MYAAGYRVVLRYVCQDTASTHGKLISKTEYDALRAAGLEVLLNYEWSTQRPLAAGAAGGQLDAEVANAQADNVGYPTTKPIYVSVDTAATVDQVRPYFQGWRASRRPVGFYGGQQVGLALLREGLVSHLWVANAASWSGFNSWDALRANVSGEAHMIQHLDHPLGFAGAIDHNEILRPDYGGATEEVFPTADNMTTLSEWLKQIEARLSQRILDSEQREALRIAAVAGAVAAEVAKQVGAASGTTVTIDVQAIAKAVADEEARRLSS